LEDFHMQNHTNIVEDRNMCDVASTIIYNKNSWMTIKSVFVFSHENSYQLVKLYLS